MANRNTFFAKNPPTYSKSGDNILPNLEVQLFGNWPEAIKFVQGLGPKVKDAGIKAQLKLGRELVKKVKGHLRNQDLGWKPLSERYASAKSEAGLDSRMLIAHGEYYHAIETWEKSNQHLIFIGVKKGKYTRNLSGRKSKLTIAQIAYMHEYSRGKKFPRRPLWNPTISEMGGARGFKKQYTQLLKAALIIKGIKVTGKIF